MLLQQGYGQSELEPERVRGLYSDAGILERRPGLTVDVPDSACAGHSWDSAVLSQEATGEHGGWISRHEDPASTDVLEWSGITGQNFSNRWPASAITSRYPR